MAIGYFKCGNISCSRFAGIDQANASPCKRCTSELDRQHVADHTRKTAIAVRERMDGNEPVAESDGNFIGWVGSMLDPISRVVDQLTKVHGDSVRIDAHVARRGEIGRASCRERVCQYVWISVGAVSYKEKNEKD